MRLLLFVHSDALKGNCLLTYSQYALYKVIDIIRCFFFRLKKKKINNAVLIVPDLNIIPRTTFGSGRPISTLGSIISRCGRLSQIVWKPNKWLNKRRLLLLIVPDVAVVRQQRLNRRICVNLVLLRGRLLHFRGPLSLWEADSTVALPADLHFAALAGKVVLA